MEEDIRSLRRQLRILKILVVVGFALNFATFLGILHVAQQSMDTSWKTIGMFQSLSRDQQSLRREVDRDRRDSNAQ